MLVVNLVFQGTNDYCFVALVDRSGGANATKSVGLVLFPTDKGFKLVFEIVFPGETDQVLIGFYKALANRFDNIKWDGRGVKANLEIGEFPKDNPELLYNWLKVNYPILKQEALASNIPNLLPSDDRFKELQENLNVKLKEASKQTNNSVNMSSNSIKDEFSNWLMGEESSNKITSYLRAIDILNEILDTDLYLNHDKKQLQLLYDDLIKEQRNVNGKYFYKEAPSYGNNGFYSASVRAFQDFLIEKYRMKIFSDFKNYLSQFNFTKGTIGAYVGSVEHKVPLEWKRLYNEEFSNFKYTIENLEKLKGITRRTYQGDFKGKRNFSEFLTFLISNFKPDQQLNLLKTTTINQILYGPPGTGKTYFLKDQLFDTYTSKQTSITKAQHLETVVSNCSWWQVIAIALLDLGSSKVSDIFEHEWVKTKTRLSNSKTVRPTLWGQLQSHTIEECEYVNVSSRQQPLIFNKTEDSFWGILEDQVEELAPELYDIKDSVDNYNPDPDKIIKHYDFVTFHQSFAYEDFIEGIKPVIPELDDIETKDLGYTIEDGVFKRLCIKATNDPDNRYAIFIDEINRGNVSAIFGELITLIELDKRKGAKNEMSIKLPYSKKDFSVPSNLDIYGTMNTADRSVEALDTALRRRFEFKEMMPDYSVIDDEAVGDIQLSEVLETINQRIELLIDRDHTIGHSYFVDVDTELKLANAFNNKIVPLLQEYFYGDYGKIGLVLGKGFVDINKNDSVEFANFEYENANDFKTPTYTLKQVDEKSIVDAVTALLRKKETI